jgi:hypothetical protein
MHTPLLLCWDMHRGPSCCAMYIFVFSIMCGLVAVTGLVAGPLPCDPVWFGDVYCSPSGSQGSHM